MKDIKVLAATIDKVELGSLNPLDVFYTKGKYYMVLIRDGAYIKYITLLHTEKGVMGAMATTEMVEPMFNSRLTIKY